MPIRFVLFHGHSKLKMFTECTTLYRKCLTCSFPNIFFLDSLLTTAATSVFTIPFTFRLYSHVDSPIWKINRMVACTPTWSTTIGKLLQNDTFSLSQNCKGNIIIAEYLIYWKFIEMSTSRVIEFDFGLFLDHRIWYENQFTEQSSKNSK